jgi:cell volume regulation protein A
MDQNVILTMLAVGLILVISVFASKLSSRYGIPVLLFFIGIGMLCGSEGPIGISFHDPHFAHTLGTIALIFILFSGGLSTMFKSVAPIWREGVTLAFFGVLISTGIMSLIIHSVVGLDWFSSALLGATVSSTDAAAVFGILKTRNLGLKEDVQSIIELESGSNDPMAVFLTLSLIQTILTPAAFSWTQYLIHFFIQMSLGGLSGWFAGALMVRLINWLDLEFEGLYPVLTIAGVLMIYSFTEYCGGNGFLSVYLMGLSMAPQKYFSRKTLGVFHDGIAWLAQVAMFLTMGLLVNPSEIIPVMGIGILLSICLMIAARPVSVFLCLLPYGYKLREMWFISWGGLRGAVPIILASYLLVSGVPHSRMMFNIVFFIVVFSMLIQGTTLGFMARIMRIRERISIPKRLPFKSRSSNRDFIEFEVGRDSPFLGKNILELGLPHDTLVVLIHRQDKDFIPAGNTEVQLYDRLVCLVSLQVIPELEKLLLIHPDKTTDRGF